ncbi:helix-turn-helix domain-containing protein [Caballeronia sordidicola]|uniref:helix-turn-helix domain-containing protein n=1 Tax=Caballeronia sordidicola TaxID=196367 RepID=UPI000AB15BAB|nr:helix-turn-helix domain-containing protein [Caballeronia sordidicola]
MQSIQHFMLDNLGTRHTLTSIAERLHMSPRNLSRIFVKECGISLMAYLNDARIDSARQHLETTDLAIAEIARRCGFDGTDALRRSFFRRLRINPAEYRSRFRSSISASNK